MATNLNIHYDAIYEYGQMETLVFAVSTFQSFQKIDRYVNIKNSERNFKHGNSEPDKTWLLCFGGKEWDFFQTP